MPANELLSVEDLEERSGISKYTWRAWFRQGRVSFVKLGGRVLMREEDYEKLIMENRHPEAPKK